MSAMIEQLPGPGAAAARLRAIVSVPPEKSVICQEPGCGRTVHAAVHVVMDGGQLKVLGSRCFAKRYGGELALGAPQFGVGGGRRLTDEERELLQANTAALIEQFEAEEAAAREVKRARQALEQRAREQLEQQRRRAIEQQVARVPRPEMGGPGLSGPADSPWYWQHPNLTSVALMVSPQGRKWIRVQHWDESQKLVPRPAFDGWETALPAGIGHPDLNLGAFTVNDIVNALATLKRHGYVVSAIGRWRQISRTLRDDQR